MAILEHCPSSMPGSGGEPDPSSSTMCAAMVLRHTLPTVPTMDSTTTTVLTPRMQASDVGVSVYQCGLGN